MSHSIRALVALASTVVWVSVGGCDPVTGADAGTDAPPLACTDDASCDDGAYCNGEERCVDRVCVAGAPIVCDDGIECTVDACSESRRACASLPVDADGDGFGAVGCADGNDCDDADPRRFPGNAETCDAVDDDCDPSTMGGFDFDGDGFVSSACCNPDADGAAVCGEDCDDTRATTFPGATEVCDTLDQNCDGTADEGVDLAGYLDADLDGVGGSTAMRACAGTFAFSTRTGDCDDADELRYPGAPELCDEVDNDCDPRVDESPVAIRWYTDSDGDGFGAPDVATSTLSCARLPDHSTRPTDCDDAVAAVHPGAAELCNGRDDDCNGLLDFSVGLNDWEDDDRDGVLDARCPSGGTDCDDTDPTVGAGAPELCDGADNDCDESVDEDVLSTPYYRDVDGDGYGSIASGAVNACTQPAGFSVRGGDCSDAVPTRHPGAVEICNAADDDCDAAVDEGCVSDCPSPQIRCGGACVDPRTDERYCGALGACAGFTVCSAQEACVAGRCDDTFVTPFVETGVWSSAETDTTYTIDYADDPFGEGFVDVVYTLDGSRPGLSATTRYLGFAPAEIIVSDGELLRWVIDTSGGSIEGRRTHTFDPARRENHGITPIRLSLRGLAGDPRGPAMAASAGSSIELTSTVRMWWSAPTGYCPTCAGPQYVVSIDGIGAVDCLVPSPRPAVYPGSVLVRPAVRVDLPSTLSEGIHFIRATVGYSGGCATPVSMQPVNVNGSIVIGWIQVLEVSGG